MGCEFEKEGILAKREMDESFGKKMRAQDIEKGLSRRDVGSRDDDGHHAMEESIQSGEQDGMPCGRGFNGFDAGSELLQGLVSKGRCVEEVR